MALKKEDKLIIMGSWKNKVVASCLQEERDKQDFKFDLDELIEKDLDKEQIDGWLQGVQFLSHPELKNSHHYYE